MVTKHKTKLHGAYYQDQKILSFEKKHICLEKNNFVSIQATRSEKNIFSSHCFGDYRKILLLLRKVWTQKTDNPWWCWIYRRKLFFMLLHLKVIKDLKFKVGIWRVVCNDNYEPTSIQGKKYLSLKESSVFFRIIPNSTPDNTKVNEDNSRTNKSCARFWMFSKREKSGDSFELGQIGRSAGQIDNIG